MYVENDSQMDKILIKRQAHWYVSEPNLPIIMQQHMLYKRNKLRVAIKKQNDVVKFVKTPQN